MKYRDEEWLRNEYMNLGKSSLKIAEELNVALTTICKWLKRFDIKTRHNHPTKATNTFYKNKDWLEKQYVEKGFTMSSIAEKCNVSVKTVNDWMAKFGISSRPVGFQIGKNNFMYGKFGVKSHRWRGGEYVEQACKMCGKVRFYYPSAVQTFCSESCRSSYVTKYIISKRQRDTDIEIIVKEWLISQSIEYEPQYYIKLEGRTSTLVDFFLLPNICLYCDGDFFHQLPHQIERDGRHNRGLKKLGYKVIRLSGSAIKNGERPDL